MRNAFFIVTALLCAVCHVTKAQDVNAFHQLLTVPRPKQIGYHRPVSGASFLEVLKKFSLDSCSRIELLQYCATISENDPANEHPGMVLYQHSNIKMVQQSGGRFDKMLLSWNTISNNLRATSITFDELNNKRTWIDSALSSF